MTTIPYSSYILCVSPIWWRPGGHFSRPLLANPHFRKIFLERTARLVREIYTEDRYSALIDALVGRLEADAGISASLKGEKPTAGKKLLMREAQLLKEHLAKRRNFLLQQCLLQQQELPRWQCADRT